MPNDKQTHQTLNQHINQNYDEAEKFNKFEKQHFNINNELKIVFIGNSITHHGPAQEIGWTGNHGMAASEKEKDYCHVLFRLMNIKQENTHIANFYEIERENIVGTDVIKQIGTLFSKKPLITIIQLGDNVESKEQLEFFLKNLYEVSSIAKNYCQNIFMLSTWWESRAKDRVIKYICDLIDIKYIYIGDLYNSDLNADRKFRQFGDPGVDCHPRNWAMEQIANRIFTAVKDVVVD